MDKNGFLSEYRTGDVHVPKRRGHTVTVVLLAGICLFCILSLLVFVSKYLFADFWKGEDSQTAMLFIKDMRFSQQQSGEEGYADIDSLGIHGRVLTDFDRQYFDLPRGVYITTMTTLVPELMVGDVLMAVNDTPVTDPDELNTAIRGYDTDTPLSLSVYRNGETLVITTTLKK